MLRRGPKGRTGEIMGKKGNSDHLAMRRRGPKKGAKTGNERAKEKEDIFIENQYHARYAVSATCASIVPDAVDSVLGLEHVRHGRVVHDDGGLQCLVTHQGQVLHPPQSRSNRDENHTKGGSKAEIAPDGFGYALD